MNPMPDACADRLEVLLAELRRFVRERDWEQFHDPKNLAMAIASEAGELLAEYRWVENRASDLYSEADDHRNRIAAEIGDVGIALLLLCDRVGLDLVEAMRAKLAANAVKYPVDKSRGKPEAPGGGTKATL